MRLHTGEAIGSYTLSHRLGTGGMAEVWAAQHNELGSLVALKVLFNSSPAMRARLLREGRAQASMDHPNILPVREIITVHGAPGLVLPLVEGPALDALLKVHQPTEDEAIALFRCIVEGIAHAHQHQLIHRDLKPSNVLLDLRGAHLTPRVSDFGLVKGADWDAQTRTGELMGTLNYAAPEQLLDASSVDHRADLFSLGVLLMELLSGERPHNEASLRGILAAHKRAPVLTSLPRPWRGLCAALLQPDPAARLPDCAALLAALPAPPAADPLRSDGPLARAAQQLWTHGRLTSRAADGASTLDLSVTVDSQLSLSTPPHILPEERDAFVGRSAELHALEEHVGSSGGALVGVQGAAGLGKTRLVLHFAWQNLSSFPGGVWFCDLSDARTLEGLCWVVADMLNVRLAGEDPLATLGRALSGRGRCLLIMDNLEQVAAPATRALEAWREHAPEAVLLGTSRVRLGAAGEQLMRIEALDVEDAVGLFVTRARAVQPSFTLAPRLREDITTLVTLLDRLPLAIELAAARVSMMRPKAMLSRLGQRFRLLQKGQQTLQAAIDWSWELLSPWERACLMQCSVFEGGFTLAAAEAVVDLSPWPEAPWTPDVLQALVDASLLRALGDNALGEPRLGMYLSFQAYARQRLAEESPADSAACHRRHAMYYAASGELDNLMLLECRGGKERRWALVAELDNLIAATRHGIDSNDPQIAGLAACAAAELLKQRGPYRLAEALLTPALHALSEAAQTEELRQLQVQVLALIGLILRKQGKMESALQVYQQILEMLQTCQDRHQEGSVLNSFGILLRIIGRMSHAETISRRALQLVRAGQNQHLLSSVLLNLGNVLMLQGQSEDAKAMYQESIDVARACEDRYREGTALGNLGLLSKQKGRLDEAAWSLRRALTIAQEQGDRYQEGSRLEHLGCVLLEQGHQEEAAALYQRALRCHKQAGSQHNTGMVLGNLGILYFQQGDYEGAQTAYVEALSIARATEDHNSETITLINMANLHRSQGRTAQAEQCYRQGLALSRTLRNPRLEGIVLTGLGAVLSSLALIEEGQAVLRATGDTMLLVQGLCERAAVELHMGQHSAAAITLDEARTLAADLNLSATAELSQSIAALTASLRAASEGHPLR